MKNKVYQAILDIIAEKKSVRDALPFAYSIEVAHRLHMNAKEVEKIAEDIEGIVRGKTLNGEYYQQINFYEH